MTVPGFRLKPNTPALKPWLLPGTIIGEGNSDFLCLIAGSLLTILNTHTAVRESGNHQLVPPTPQQAHLNKFFIDIKHDYSK